MPLLKKIRLIQGLKIGVTLILLAWTLRLVHLGNMLDQIRHADPRQLAIAGALLILGGFAGAASWFCVLRLRLPHLGYRETAAYHWTGMFFNSFLPSNVGGDAVKGYLVARNEGEVGFVVISLLIDRAVNLALLIDIGLIAFLFWRNQPAAGVLLLLATPASLALLPTLVSRWRNRLRKTETQAPQKWHRLRSALAPLWDLLESRRRLTALVTAASLSQLLKTWQNVFLAAALGLSLPAICIWFVVPLFGVISGLPISIGGLGVRETVAFRLAAPLHIDATQLVMFSLAGQGIVTLVNLIGVLPFVWTKRKTANETAQATR